MTETAAVKARRLLQEGRLMIERIDPDSGFVKAQCRGDSGTVYNLGRDPRNGQWRCTCQAHGNCSHLLALKLVVAL